MHFTSWLVLLATLALWSGNWIVARAVRDEIAPGIATAGRLVIVLTILLIRRSKPNLNGLMNLPAVAQVLPAPLVILMLHTADGKLTVSLTRRRMDQNSIGSARACWADGQITGEEFHCVLAQKILKEKVLMV